MTSISQNRAEKIARSHPCDNCGEYSFKTLKVKPAAASDREAFGEVWHITKICGVCGMHHEIGIDKDGDIVYAT